ncbi:thioesterase family protein [Nocardioides sp. AE5]|uniref:thioesterase family protein n=1 Tax=Nocardioides sp. AE5 TaxID=2962573 RepID=UPI00288230CF|nr:thioesterase family protein [Nocardioides sp. AE5]MDT0202703.1 thioesterase family protein [Nocardioides sp. AE5]
MRVPTLEQVRRLPTSASVTVGAERIDGNDHLSVHHVVELAAHGAHELLVGCGLTDERRSRTGKGVFTAEHHLAYLHEVRQGARLTVHTRILDRSERAVLMAAFVVDQSRMRTASLLRTVVVSVDLSTRRSVPFPDDVAGALDRLLEEHAALPWDAPEPGWGALRHSSHSDESKTQI